MSAADRDRIAAGLNSALAFRFLYNLVVVRMRAEGAGADLSAMPDLPSPADITDRYERLLEQWLPEKPETAASIRAFVDVAAAILIDQTVCEMLNEGTILGPERDREHAIRALLAIGGGLIDAENQEASRQGAGYKGRALLTSKWEGCCQAAEIVVTT